MNPFEMVVIVVFLLVVGSIFSSLAKGREHRHHRKEEERSSSREADELRELMLRLEDRIRVLERIVTDSNSREDLRRQFRDLER